MLSILSPLIRRYMTGSSTEFVFKPVTPCKLPLFPKLEKIDLYLTIPFCKSICPYCPYNKVRYDKSLIEPYLNAILNEIDLYYEQFGRIKIPSLYIGGGTPTTLLDELGLIIEKIKNRFDLIGDICIETSPSDIDHDDAINKLISYGVNMISLGVQSFNEKYLQLIGRDYKMRILYPVIEHFLAFNFKTVNIDLMFALPGQTVNEVMEDLQTAINAGVNQITLYPLFTFPYSTAGKYLKIKNLQTPSHFTRRKMYHAINDFCTENGFQRVSVWGFKHGTSPHYSSVTRDNYLGLGAGAGSHLPGMFYINTFSVKEYIKTCSKPQLPIALAMNATPNITNNYWLYWQFYGTYINKKELADRFGNNKKIKTLFRLLKFFNFCKENDVEYYLTESGSFWAHLMQNYYVINYFNKIQSVGMQTPWPQAVKL